MGTELALKMDGMVQLGSTKEALEFCGVVQRSGLAPKTLDTPEKMLVALQMGAELGLSPMTSIQNIAVIQGRPAIYGKAVMGLIQSRGVLDGWKETIEGTGENMVAKVWVKRGNIEKTGVFSWQDAKRAGLTGKDTYKNYPADMLTYRARARATVLFADIIHGLGIVEDLQDVSTAKPVREVAAVDPLLATPVIKSIESELPAIEIPEPGSFDGEEDTAYVTFSRKMRQCTNRTELEALALEIKAKKSLLKDEDELNDLRNLCAERKAELK